MRILILGFGRFGSSIAHSLTHDGHEVTVVEIKKDLVEQAQNTLDLKAIQGYGAYPNVLANAGCADADLLIAATGVDEVNMVACQIAHTLYNVPMKIARLHTDDYINEPKVFSDSQVPVDSVVVPEYALAENLAELIAFHGACEVIKIYGMRFFGIRVIPGSQIVGQSFDYIKEILSKEEKLWASFISRNHKILSKEEDEDLILRAYDVVYFCSEASIPSWLISLFGEDSDVRKNVVILGSGRVGTKLATQLSKGGFSVKIIEADEEKANQVAYSLPDVHVLHGSAIDSKTLKTMTSNKGSVLVGVTDKDEVNLISMLIAKKENPDLRTVTLLGKRNFAHLLGSFNIDVTLFSWNVTVPLIMKYVTRAGFFEVNYILLNCDAQCVVMNLTPDSWLIGTEVATLNNKYCVLPISIKRNGEFIDPANVIDFEVGDLLIGIVEFENLAKVERDFSGKIINF